jgi:hypothetical protein
MATTPDSSALSTVAYNPDAADDLTNRDSHHRQYVSDPIKAQTISGTIKGQFQCLETLANDNLFLTLKVYVVSNDGSTVRGTLLPITRDTTTELATTLTNRNFPSTALTSVVALENDRIVIEVGLGGSITSGTGGIVGHNGSIRWGCNASSGDLPEDDTQTGTTYRPWVEFSQNILFQTRGRISWAEFEAPFVATRGRISWAELEVPIASTRGRISWSEFEVPSAATSPTRGRISWAELETPFVTTRGRVSWAELEVPIAPTQGRISWAEFEAPLAPTRGRASWAELEVPFVGTRGRISWAELETPLVPTRGRFSWAELETPFRATRGRASWMELEVPVAVTRGRISYAELEVPDVTTGNVTTGHQITKIFF